ncbi:MAG: cob(I)yrinic acid a,c-diamide adenosyltransferase [Chloroflexi bacterium]|nr:cob(I)yrinic acid a,c-diamide adenosyltransferase [Chloroflexota bacterium]
MKIYTRSGDEGDTGLFGGPRVPKDDARVEAYGAVDELNAALGVAAAGLDRDASPDLAEMLHEIQSTLFDLGGELATPDARERAASGKLTPLLAEGSSERLEGWIDALEEELEPLTQFILPGGAPVAAQLQLARTVCRRAERRAVSLAAIEDDVAGEVLVYLNRLSDFLFGAARAVNRREGVEEPRWASPRWASEES